MTNTARLLIYNNFYDEKFYICIINIFPICQ